MNYELIIWQSFAKLRRIWGNNFAGERRDQASMNMEERALLEKSLPVAHLI
jgi:hypothetical protein